VDVLAGGTQRSSYITARGEMGVGEANFSASLHSREDERED